VRVSLQVQCVRTVPCYVVTPVVVISLFSIITSIRPVLVVTIQYHTYRYGAKTMHQAGGTREWFKTAIFPMYYFVQNG